MNDYYIFEQNSPVGYGKGIRVEALSLRSAKVKATKLQKRTRSHLMIQNECSDVLSIKDPDSGWKDAR